MTIPSQQNLRDNLVAIQDRIVAAALRAGRDPHEVRLVAVTKYVDEEVTRRIVESGCMSLGESRPQSLWEKAAALQDLPQIEWHLIGHLQRNKLRRTLPIVSLIHSVDSLRLLESIDEEAAHQSITVPILLEVNVAGEKAKHGFSPAQSEEGLVKALSCSQVDVRGLMCMAGLKSSPREARHQFEQLRDLRDHLQSRFREAHLPELSMGMSGDFEGAIEAGATLVRVGSALFSTPQ